MAKKGLSRLFMAKYSYDPDEKKVKYSDGCENEKMASYSTEISSSENSNLYLNNEIAETEGGKFQSGTFTLETGDLTPETSVLICGLKKKTVSLTELSSESIEEVIYDDDMKPTNLGIGTIELHQVDGVEFYRAIVLPKVFFNVPSGSATTKGESVEWQTQETTGTIQRSDELSEDVKHPWQRHADCKTEEIAVAYIKQLLNITDQQ